MKYAVQLQYATITTSKLLPNTSQELLFRFKSFRTEHSERGVLLADVGLVGGSTRVVASVLRNQTSHG